MRVFVIVYILLWILGIIGWGMNLYKITQLDFNTPYKTEIIRGIGIPVAPFGAIIGYMDIGEENK